MALHEMDVHRFNVSIWAAGVANTLVGVFEPVDYRYFLCARYLQWVSYVSGWPAGEGVVVGFCEAAVRSGDVNQRSEG